VIRTGLDQFLDYLQIIATQAPPDWAGAVWFILRIGEDCAGIRLQDGATPLRFLRQMANAPPLQFGTSGFSPAIVDDDNPARHYVAFVFVGFWLPTFLAILVLYSWEMAGFVRYRGYWSPNDLASGRLGIAHGRWLQRTAPAVLPGLAAQLADASRLAPTQVGVELAPSRLAPSRLDRRVWRRGQRRWQARRRAR
jgi:hypothetical protein